VHTISCHHHGAGFSHYSCVLLTQAKMVGGAEFVTAVQQTAFIVAVTFCILSQKCSGTKVLCRVGLLPLRLIRSD